MQVLTLETLDHQTAWDEFVHQSSRSVHYHLFGWKRVLEKSYRIRTVYLMVYHHHRVAGILPLALVRGVPSAPHLVSLPYLSYCGICTDIPAVAQALLQEAIRWYQHVGAKYLRFNNVVDLKQHPLGQEADATPPKPSDWGCSHRLVTDTNEVTLVRPLPEDPDRLWASFNPKIRNHVRKAVKAGLRIDSGGREFIDDFYQVFAENMRDLGSPVHSIGFFQSVLEEFPQATRLFVVYRNVEPIGAALVVTFRETAEVPWSSSRRPFFHCRPNHFLFWNILKFCCEQGVQNLDFGRSTRGSGTYEFKRQWGAIPKQLYWQYYLPEDCNAPGGKYISLQSRFMTGIFKRAPMKLTDSMGRILVNTWKRLPLGLANRIGPRVRRNIPD